MTDRPLHVASDGTVVPMDDEQFAQWQADQAAAAAAATAPPPDAPTLGDWRVALVLWGRLDDVLGRAAALLSSADAATKMLGKVVQERLEYSNNVFRAQLLSLKDALGFTAADVDESLYRANRVSLGDLSGQWPPPTPSS